VSELRPVTATEVRAGIGSAIAGAWVEITVASAKGACAMQHVVQQWWWDVRGFSSSPPHSPTSHPAQPTHGSPAASESAMSPPVAPKKRTNRADSARSAIARAAVLKRLEFTRATIGSEDQYFKWGSSGPGASGDSRACPSCARLQIRPVEGYNRPPSNLGRVFEQSGRAR